MIDPADKRRTQRFPMALPVAVRVQESESGEAIVSTKDISSSGVYMDLNVPMEVGSSLEFTLTLPSEITKGNPVKVKCRGKVVRVDRKNEGLSPVGVAATIERYEFLREP